MTTRLLLPLLSLLLCLALLGTAAALSGVAIVRPPVRSASPPAAAARPAGSPTLTPNATPDARCAQGLHASSWETEWIAAPRRFSSMRPDSLALDAVGHPHIAYGGDHLYYAHHDGMSWQIETVDPQEEVGIYASLELDAAGHPHIAYYARGANELRYAFYDGATWQIQVVDPHDGMS